MNIDLRIKAFARLGDYLRNIPLEELQTLSERVRNENPWFSAHSVEMALRAIAEMVTEDSLKKWVKNYKLSSHSRRVGLVLAGNIPLVGFHDVMCVLISGHTAIIKLSSKDVSLIRFITEKLIEFEPQFSGKVVYAEQLRDFEAVIATGSDNTSRYFDFYFRKYPHIIRRNRTSVAVLTGNESVDELQLLGKDVFTYYGLGCRNVSKLFIPKGYEFNGLFEAWQRFEDVIHHHKYANNYDYQKSILLVNREAFLDNGFVILQKSDKIVSPISVVYYEEYSDEQGLSDRLAEAREKIQVVVGRSHLSFGEAQQPAINEYADNVDTMAFLQEL